MRLSVPRSKIKAVLQSETRIRVSLPNTASRSTAALSSQGLCHPIANSQSRRTLTTSHIAVPSGSNSRFRMMSTSASIPALSQSPAPKPIEVDLDILFSSTADPSLLSEDLQILLFSAGCGGRWHLTGQRNGLERSFKFKTFTKTWEFMNAVAAECSVKKHHPEWSNVYNTTFIRWTTHSPPGLSAKDVAMAAFCDSQAAALGEIVQEHTKEVESNVRNETGRDLVDHVAAVGGDCCLPKSNR